MTSAPLPIAVLISGGGTTLRNLIAKRDAGDLDVDFRCVISSNPKAAGLAFAREANIPAEVIERQAFASVAEYSRAIFDRCRAAGIQLVVCGGFLKLLEIPPDFEGRVINIHPSLIPICCGHGFYGQRVHQGVLDAGLKISGCTAHFVDNEFDHGPIILQRSVPVEEDDTAETLAARVFAVECETLPEAIRLYQCGRLKIEGHRVRVLAAAQRTG